MVGRVAQRGPIDSLGHGVLRAQPARLTKIIRGLKILPPGERTLYEISLIPHFNAQSPPNWRSVANRRRCIAHFTSLALQNSGTLTNFGGVRIRQRSYPPLFGSSYRVNPKKRRAPSTKKEPTLSTLT